MMPTRAPAPLRLLWLAACVATVLFAVHAGGIVELPSGVANHLNASVFLIAAGVTLARGLRPGGLPWALFGTGLLLYGIGWIAYVDFDLDLIERHVQLSDVLWWTFYPFALAATVTIMVRQLRGTRVWLWTDGAIAGVGLVTIGLHVTLGPVLSGPSEPWPVVLGGAYYVSGDLLILGLLVSLTAFKRRLSPAESLMAACIGLFAIGDAQYAYQIGHGLPWQGGLDDFVWAAGAVLLSRAAWARQPGLTVETAPPTRACVPAVTVLAALATELIIGPTGVASWFTAATIVLVVVRLWLSGRETAHLLEAARAGRDQLQATIDNLRGVRFFAKDAEGRYVLVNREFAESLGLPREQIIGRRQEEVVPGEVAEATLAAEQAVRERGVPVETEERVAEPDGTHTYIAIRFPYSGPGVECGGGVCGVATDITDRLRVEHDRRELQAQLHRSQKLETVGRLAGGIAHDFNNLLAVILNYAEFAAGELDGHPAKADVEEIRMAAERAAGLTRQLLVFSRGRPAEPEEDMDVNEVVGEMGSMLSRTLGERVRLETRLTPDAWPVRVDRTQLEQVLMNLAVNARDAMPGGGALTITTSNIDLDQQWADLRPGAVPGRYVSLTVRDTGEGMTPEVQERAFDPFFTTKPVGQGTGLGLATVYGAVHAAGGFIHCDSTLGEGTAFHVQLPVAESHVREAAIAPSRGAYRRRGTGTILLAEDEAALRRMAARLLEQSGFTVIQAGSGDEALRLLDQAGGRVDLLVSDVVMPGMGGAELAESLRARDGRLPLVFMSGYADRAERLPGDAGFVAKPFTGDALLDAVGEALSRAPVPASA